MKRKSFTTAKAFLIALFAFWCQASLAQTSFEVNGLHYTTFGDKPSECAVTDYTGNSTTVTIPTTVTYGGQTYTVTSIGEYAFSGCSSLTSITIPEGVTSIGDGAFSGCSNLTIILDEGNANYSCVDNVLYNKAQTELISCQKSGDFTVPQSVRIIAPYAFSRSRGLTSVIIPDGVTSIGWSAFSGCSNLTSITIPEGVTSIGWSAFSGCSNLTSITIPESVTSIGDGAFSGCSNLTNVTVLCDIKMNRVFDGCNNLKALKILTTANLFPDSSYPMPQSVEEIYLEFSLPEDYNQLYEHVKRVLVPVGYKDRYVYNVQRSNPWYTGDNVKEIDFEEKSFTIETSEGYGTYYTDRPFVMPEGAEGGIIKGFDDEGILDIDYRYKAGDIVPANMGILLKGAPGTYDYEPTFYFEAPYAPGNNLLEGSTENMQLPESDDLYYMLSYDDNGENIGFYWGANFGRPFLNKAHHAYFALPKSEAAGAKAFQLGPNPSTGIGTVVENDGTTATVYTLTGTKVTTPVDDLPRGIYIINEKKTLIK